MDKVRILIKRNDFKKNQTEILELKSTLSK